MVVPFPSECRESKVRYPAPWGPRGGEASAFQGLPWGIDTFHFSCGTILSGYAIVTLWNSSIFCNCLRKK